MSIDESVTVVATQALRWHPAVGAGATRPGASRMTVELLRVAWGRKEMTRPQSLRHDWNRKGGAPRPTTCRGAIASGGSSARARSPQS